MKSLEEEMELLTQDLDAADEEVEVLTQKLHDFEEKAKEGFYLSKKTVLEEIKSILGRSLHTVNLTTPTIEEISELDLYEVKSSVNIKVATWIDPSNPNHQDVLNELRFDNIMIRIDDFRDRYCILRDGEELFFGIVGNNDDEILTLRTKDSKHIKLLSSLVMESWLRARKLTNKE
ncbi:MAG: hypothetical protein ACTSVK_13700 [Promethearchaeota archaeon]